ncbi:hypothetical protein PoB_003095500 [Plakobranchus ocellatus]|uniref:Uncharacterized protein n=1 Tax=Plakobranchus ocellatus TaxID=259542 RepID=A0AAV4A8F2_9GAST|nr:hypothetical protein PoB_003095500 [Plakobranchus ocellatus]
MSVSRVDTKVCVPALQKLSLGSFLQLYKTCGKLVNPEQTKLRFKKRLKKVYIVENFCLLSKFNILRSFSSMKNSFGTVGNESILRVSQSRFSALTTEPPVIDNEERRGEAFIFKEIWNMTLLAAAAAVAHALFTDNHNCNYSELT